MPRTWTSQAARARNVAGQRLSAPAARASIFDRPAARRPTDFAAGARAAREIGTRAAVLLQNNGALPLSSARDIVPVGKTSQPYAQQAIAGGVVLGKPMGAGGGSSDIVPERTFTPAEGIRNAMAASGVGGPVIVLVLVLVLVDGAKSTATRDGAAVLFE